MKESFECSTCKKVHRFPVYIFAHWCIKIIHECEYCGAKHEILRGYAKQIKAGKLCVK